MGETKRIKGKFIPKYEMKEDWDKSEYVPEKGEIVESFTKEFGTGPADRDSTNIIPFPKLNYTEKGLTITTNENGSYTISGTATDDGSIDFFDVGDFSKNPNNFPQGITVSQEGFSFSQDNGSAWLWCTIYVDVSGSLYDTNLENYNVYTDNVVWIALQYQTGATFDTTFTLMANEGNTVLPYEPHYKKGDIIDNIEILKANIKIGDGECKVKDLPPISGSSELIGKGQAENTIITKITSEEEQSRALTKYSSAFGAANISGSRAYLIKSYSTNAYTHTIRTPEGSFIPSGGYYGLLNITFKVILDTNQPLSYAEYFAIKDKFDLQGYLTILRSGDDSYFEDIPISKVEGDIITLVDGREFNVQSYDDAYESNPPSINITGASYYELYHSIEPELVEILRSNNFEDSDYDIILPSVNRIKWGKITNIDGTKVYVDKVEVGDVGNPVVSDWDSSNNEARFFKLINYPEYGDVECGSAASTLGYNNKALAYCAIAVGSGNVADGKYSFVAGRGNFAGYSGSADGCFNEVTGINGKASGYMNKVTAHSAQAINMYNEASGQASFVAGYGNIANKSGQFVAGKFNKINDNAIFIIGNGTAKDNKVTTRIQATKLSNAFEVLEDGRATIGKAPEQTMDISNKGYVDSLATEKVEKTGTHLIFTKEEIPQNTLLNFNVQEDDKVLAHSTNLMLLRSKLAGSTSSGVKIEKVEDGLITFSGAPSNAVSIDLTSTMTAPKSGVYTIFMNFNGQNSTLGGRVRFYKADGNTLAGRIDNFVKLEIDFDNKKCIKTALSGNEITYLSTDNRPTNGDNINDLEDAVSWKFVVDRQTNNISVDGVTCRPQVYPGKELLEYEPAFVATKTVNFTQLFEYNALYINSLNNQNIICSYNKPLTYSVNRLKEEKADKLYVDNAINSIAHNAFATIKVNNAYITADYKTDMLTLIAGSNITLTPDAHNDSITISAEGSGNDARLPTVTSTDNGKFLRVINGAWQAVSIPVAEEQTY